MQINSLAFEKKPDSPSNVVPLHPLKQLFAWTRNAQAGDFARIIFAPVQALRAHYGQPLNAGRVFFLERLLGGADVAVIQSFKRKLVVMDASMLAAIMEARDVD